jgi:Virulence-associated protein E-like domain
MTAFKQAHKSVIEYLASLVWDGTPRLDRWLVDYAGAEDSPRVRAVSRAMLVAAARRARHPGCRFDQLPVLEGPQGCGKTSALRALAVEDAWFTDEFPLDERGLVEATAGKWIVAASELRNMGLSDVAALKACLSRQHDAHRGPYVREVSQVPRQFVVVGTADMTAGYLCGATGSRRFWPVRVRRFDLDKLRVDRDQLWAEAATVEATGASIRFEDGVGDVAEEQLEGGEQRARAAAGTAPLDGSGNRTEEQRAGALRRLVRRALADHLEDELDDGELARVVSESRGYPLGADELLKAAWEECASDVEREVIRDELRLLLRFLDPLEEAPREGELTRRDRRLSGSQRTLVRCLHHHTTRDPEAEPCWQCWNEWDRSSRALASYLTEELALQDAGRFLVAELSAEASALGLGWGDVLAAARASADEKTALAEGSVFDVSLLARARHGLQVRKADRYGRAPSRERDGSVGVLTWRRAEQEGRLADDDPFAGMLLRVLGDCTGRLRVSDAHRICGIAPGKVDQLSRLDRAIRGLGWERQRCCFNGSLQYAYVRGTATEREVELIFDGELHVRSVR